MSLPACFVADHAPDAGWKAPDTRFHVSARAILATRHASSSVSTSSA